MESCNAILQPLPNKLFKPFPNCVESKTRGILIMTNLLNTNHKPFEFMPIDEFS